MTDSGPEDRTAEDRRATENGTAETPAGGTRSARTAPGPVGPASSSRIPPPPGRRRRRWMRIATVTASLAVLAASGIGWTVYNKLDGNIRTDVGTAKKLEHYEDQRPRREAGEARNILLLGSDSRRGGNSRYGRDAGGQHSDTAILLHLSADRRSATGVSLPRDLMVDIPACTGRDGDRVPARFAQFNTAFQTGGAACTIRTVETLTGLRVNHHLVVDFTGFKALVDKVGGVEVCLPESVHDRDAKLELPAGRQTLGGEDALGYVRTRHGLGNGSDTGRMSRQQQFLGSLVKKVRSNGVLLNPAKLYPVLHSATSALTADQGLDSLSELYELAHSLRNIPEDRVRFLTVPRQAYRHNRNRDELVQPDADRLFGQLREDRPVRVEAQPGEDSGEDAGGSTGEGTDQGTADGKGAAGPAPSGSSASPARDDEKPADEESGNPAAGGAVRSSVRDRAAEPDQDGGDRVEEPAPVYRGTTAARDVCRT